MSASQYERELKGILEGEAKILSKITKTCSTLEKVNYSKISDKPFAVIRAAGSLGVDLVATRGDIS
ncbi:MAG: Holliday junction resolvase, partial [Thermoplasmatales archaeon]|nr:Holliday junction resolvase [Thermoplasmatales archaeon]